MLSRLFQSSEDRGGVRRATLTALVIALLAGTTGAFALTEALKLDRAVVAVRRFDRALTPACRCPTRTATFVIRLRAPDTIDVDIIDAEGEQIRALAAGLARRAGIVRLRWAGRGDAGHLVPAGSYRLRIRLRDQNRTVVIRHTIRVAASSSV